MASTSQALNLAEWFMLDLKSGIPNYIVFSAAQKHLDALYLLPEGTEDKEKAIHDVEKFLKETESNPPSRHASE